MTDGERLVWATSFSIVLDRDGDPIIASRAAARAVADLREVAVRRTLAGDLVVESDEREFLDEIVSSP